MNCDGFSEQLETITFRSLRETASKIMAIKLLRAKQPALGLRDAKRIVDDLSAGTGILVARLSKFERAAFECVGFNSAVPPNATIHYL